MAARSGEQRRSSISYAHVCPALVQPEPSALYCELEAGAVFGRPALELGQERPVDLLDVDATVLHRLDGVGDLQELARGDLGIGEGTTGDERNAALASMCAA